MIETTITMKHIYCTLISYLSFMTSFSQTKLAEISHYLFPEFTQGYILLKNGTGYKSLLNYSSLTEEMVFEENGKRLTMSKLASDEIDTVFIGGRKFIRLSNTFIELIHHSKFDLFVEHKCSVQRPGKESGYGGTSQTSAIDSYSSLISNGHIYDLKLPDGYEAKTFFYYWLKKNGAFKMFVNMRQLKDLYHDKKDLLDAYVKQNDIKYNNQESIIQLIEYLETNI